MKFGIVIPVFNHARTVAAVVEGVRAAVGGMVDEIVVVDDGCTDGSGEILRGMAGVTVLKHERNRGKGRALLTGFGYLKERGFTHVATIDADGQHDAGDLVKLIGVAREHGEDLIIGMRDMDSPPAGVKVPAASKKGRDAARFWLRVQTGQDIPDSQCGLRVYPLEYVLAAKYRFRRFDFETEVLARMAWAGLRVRSVGIRCIYFAGNERVSHYRPVVDTVRGVRVNVFLVLRRLAPVPFRRLIRRPEGTAEFGSWWRWGTWKKAFGAALREGSSNVELSTAFALGVFIGLTPFYMLQTLITIFFARRLHLNLVAAVIGSQISIPPLAPVWFFLSLATGNLILHGQWVHERVDGSVWQWLWQGKWPFLLGNVVVAVVVAAGSYFLSRVVLGLILQRKHVKPEAEISEALV